MGPTRTSGTNTTSCRGQVIGVDPDISGNQFTSCSIMDDTTGLIVWRDSGTLGDGHDINCLVNTYGRNVESQAFELTPVLLPTGER
jgi:hypothetical protein